MEKTQDDIESHCVLKNRIEECKSSRWNGAGGFGSGNNPLISTNSKLIYTKLFVLISFVLVLFGGIRVAEAADISFSPSSGTYRVGDTFPVGVVISSPSQQINAASARILFPPSKLEVVHISKSASILDLWIAEPAYSNGAGTIDFEGIAFNPGYQGGSGQVILVTFRAKDTGSIPLSFSSASVLANDGNGTDVLAGIGSALFEVSRGSASAPVTSPSASPPSVKNAPAPRTEIPTAPIDVDKNAPSAPRVYSSTHPDPKQWYSESTAVFEWTMPVNATGARLLWGSKENALPTIYYDEPLNNKTIALGDDIPDGTYYFHVQSRDAGGWSNVAHFQFNVDRTPPDSLGIQCFGDSGVCSASFRVNAHDETAGISHFLMQIDNQEPELWRDYGGSHIWKPPSLRAGTHILQVTAVDAAGNSIEKKVQFESVATFPLVSSWSLSLRNSQIAGLLFIAAGLILAVLVFTKKRRRYFAPVSANQSRRSTTAQAGRLALRMVLLPLVWVLRQGGSVAYAGGRALRAILLSLWQVLRFALLIVPISLLWLLRWVFRQGGEAAHAIGRALRAILLSLWHVLRFALRMALLLLVWLIRTGFYLYHRGWRRKAAYAKKKITKPRINV